MPIGRGTRIGPYEITALIGEGGMGRVWRAHHTALKRDDALKVLPDAFAADPERLARFQREAQVLASLNHPNIAHVYGLEQSEGVQALVMELVEGPTLADRVAQGAIPVDEALPIAKQIAEALEGAHEQGIIHRDLKPANIKLRPDGTVKVLDFGLAKVLEPTASLPNLSDSPTITSPAMTQRGVLLGTAAYMSPEQAKGRPADKRSDVWAFGAVLFEMLTGRRAFAGGEIYEVLASVLAREPDWSLLPRGLSPTLASYIKRCLHKDPKQRIGDVQSLRLALEGAFDADAERTVTTAALLSQPSPSIGWRAMPWVLASVLAGGVVLWAVMMRPEPAPSASLTRFSIPLAANESFTLGNRLLIAISPNGSHVVYTANQGLSLRPVDQLQATPIPDTAGAFEPFFSPDGQWIGFFAAGQLKRVSVTGGTAYTMGAVALPFGAWWGDDGTILVGQGPKGILRVPAAGGTPEVSIPVEAGQLAQSPQMLPGGEWVLFTLRLAGSFLNQGQIVMQSLATGERTVLIEGGRDAKYLTTGHLVYARDAALLAVPFDLGARRVTGGPVPLVENIGVLDTGSSAAQFSVAIRNGSLAYVASGSILSLNAPRTLVWVDRKGRETPLAAPPRGYVYARLSPDGTRVVLDVRQPADIWLWDLSRETLTRLTFEPGADRAPVWSPDGQRIAFSSQRDGSRGNLFWQAADGTGAAERIAEGERDMFPTSFSPDASQILMYVATGGATGAQAENDDIAVVSKADSRVTSLLATMYGERNGEVSPDGRWLAYESNESGRDEIYVRPFPDMQGGRWQISNGGGTRPLWARNGRELFYLFPPGRVMSVPIQSGTTFSVGNPQLVFDGPYLAPNSGRTYDVSPNGERFLMIKDAASPLKTSTPPSIIVVQGWFEELKRRVPTK